MYIDFGLLTFVLMVGFLIFYFKKNYVILSNEEWQPITECVEEYNRMVEEQEKEEEASQELAGGEGFFREYIDDDNEEEEEEEDE